MDQDTRSLYEQAEQARVGGNYEEAAAILEQILEAQGELAECLWSLGHCLMNMGDFDRAPQAFGKACELDLANPKYLLDLAKFLEMLGEFEQARPFLERIIQVAPGSREAGEAQKSLSYY
jgi:tetratricopeptide (TPR) repeat protein